MRGKTACGMPPAAQSWSNSPSAQSTIVRIGLGWPTGATPPIGWPVCSRTNVGEARRSEIPNRSQTLMMSTRCAPLVMINSGAPASVSLSRSRTPALVAMKVSKINEFAMAPTAQPSC